MQLCSRISELRGEMVQQDLVQKMQLNLWSKPFAITMPFSWSPTGLDPKMQLNFWALRWGSPIGFGTENAAAFFGLIHKSRYIINEWCLLVHHFIFFCKYSATWFRLYRVSLQMKGIDSTCLRLYTDFDSSTAISTEVYAAMAPLFGSKTSSVAWKAPGHHHTVPHIVEEKNDQQCTWSFLLLHCSKMVSHSHSIMPSHFLRGKE